jgi:hypothetical protein
MPVLVYWRTERIRRELLTATALQAWDLVESAEDSALRWEELRVARVHDYSGTGWRADEDQFLVRRLGELALCAAVLDSMSSLSRSEHLDVVIAVPPPPPVDLPALAVDRLVCVCADLIRDVVAYVSSISGAMSARSGEQAIRELASEGQMPEPIEWQVLAWPHLGPPSSRRRSAFVFPRNPSELRLLSDTLRDFVKWASQYRAKDVAPGAAGGTASGIPPPVPTPSGSGEPCSVWLPRPSSRRKPER